MELSKLVASKFTSNGARVSINEFNSGNSIFDVNNKDTLVNIEEVLIGVGGVGGDYSAYQKVLIVGAGGYTFDQAQSIANTEAGRHNIIYVADTTLSSVSIQYSGLNVVFANNSSALVTVNSSGGEINLFGNRSFIFNGANSVDIVHDYTNVVAATNVINANGGNDTVVLHGNSSTIVNGGAGDDILIGGLSDQLYGNDGKDTLLAFDGSAYLSGGAGNDILVNANISATAVTTATQMLGGSGSDAFVIMATNQDLSSGYMKTVISDLGTGDKIDLSFLETHDLNQVAGTTNVITKSVFTTTSAGTTLALHSFDLTSSQATADTLSSPDKTSVLDSNLLTVSNVNATKTSAAIVGLEAQSTTFETFGSGAHGFNDLFEPLTNNY